MLTLLLAQATTPTTTPDQDLKTLLTTGIKEEYMARATYKAANLVFNNRKPFANIVRAEEQHTRMFIKLFEARKWTLPKDDYAQKPDESNQDFAKRLNLPTDWTEALKLGVKLEKEDVKFLGDALKTDLPDDVRTTFQNLLVASRDRHLRAFEAFLKG